MEAIELKRVLIQEEGITLETFLESQKAILDKFGEYMKKNELDKKKVYQDWDWHFAVWFDAIYLEEG